MTEIMESTQPELHINDCHLEDESINRPAQEVDDIQSELNDERATSAISSNKNPETAAPASDAADDEDGKEEEEEDNIQFVGAKTQVTVDSNNSGAHTNDLLNVPDRQGRVLVNVDHPPEERDVFLHHRLVASIQPHQIGGVRFLFDTLIGRLSKIGTSSGSGCILAHSMGLGKTFQTIAFIHILLTETSSRHVLCIVPVNTLQNWKTEFQKWLPKPHDEIDIDDDQFEPEIVPDCGDDQKQDSVEDSDEVAEEEESKDGSKPCDIDMYGMDDSSLELDEDLKRDLGLVPEDPKDDDTTGGDEDTLTDSKSEDGLNKDTGSTDEVLVNDVDKSNESKTGSHGHNSPSPSAADTNKRRLRVNDIKIFSINDKGQSRAAAVREWYRQGGVMLMGYEMYRNLVDPTSKQNSRIKSKGEQKAFQDLVKALVDPGPDLVICDEGHRIKNVKGKLSQSLKAIKTHRRLVLTGYPLQNNLLEYFCMVDFVKPGRLGTREEFRTMFQNPIENGQGIDAGQTEKKLMRLRSFVLTDTLKGIVQRRSHFVLRDILPKKREHVLFCRMSEIQRRLMKAFLKYITSSDEYEKSGAIILFSICCKIWNHPDVFYRWLKGNRAKDDLDLAVTTDNSNQNSRNGKTQSCPSSRVCSAPSSAAPSPKPSFFDDFLGPSTSYTGLASGSSYNVPMGNTNARMDYGWASSLFDNYTTGILANSPKMTMLMEIVEKSISLGDRILIFSQSLVTLDLIQDLLHQRSVPTVKKRPKSEVVKKTRGFGSSSSTNGGGSEKFRLNVNYFRIDGSTSAVDRDNYINRFNQNEKFKVFLLSSRAGSLGINLTGANRIILCDASWNPCHDAQAACRIYRYGQTKECFIYRLICDNSLEKRIYDRQVHKQNIANRIVDELNAEAPIRREDITTLLHELDGNDHDSASLQIPQEEMDEFGDEIMKHICTDLVGHLSRKPHEHESLFLDHMERRLTADEQYQAKMNYASAMRLCSSSTGSSYRNTYLGLPGYRPGYIPPYTGSGGSYMSNSPGQQRSTPDVIYQSLQRYHNLNPENLCRDRVYCSLDMLWSMSQNPEIVVKELVVDRNFSFVRYENGVPEHIHLLAGQKVHLIRTRAAIYIRPVTSKIVNLSRDPKEMEGLVKKFNLNYAQLEHRPSLHSYMNNALGPARQPPATSSFPLPPTAGPSGPSMPIIQSRPFAGQPPPMKRLNNGSGPPELVELSDSDEEDPDDGGQGCDPLVPSTVELIGQESNSSGRKRKRNEMVDNEEEEGEDDIQLLFDANDDYPTRSDETTNTALLGESVLLPETIHDFGMANGTDNNSHNDESILPNEPDGVHSLPDQNNVSADLHQLDDIELLLGEE